MLSSHHHYVALFQNYPKIIRLTLLSLTQLFSTQQLLSWIRSLRQEDTTTVSTVPHLSMRPHVDHHWKHNRYLSMHHLLPTLRFIHICNSNIRGSFERVRQKDIQESRNNRKWLLLNYDHDGLFSWNNHTFPRPLCTNISSPQFRQGRIASSLLPEKEVYHLYLQDSARIYPYENPTTSSYFLSLSVK